MVTGPSVCEALPVPPDEQPVISSDTATHTLKNPAIRRFMEYLPF